VATQVVEMDYSVIQAVSKGFGEAAESLRTMAKILEKAVQVLNAMAFFSMGITKALAQWLEGIQKAMENLAKVCEEFSEDLARAIDDHKKGDIEGKSYFGEGV
jgi:hypothetical protein